MIVYDTPRSVQRVVPKSSVDDICKAPLTSRKGCFGKTYLVKLKCHLVTLRAMRKSTCSPFNKSRLSWYASTAQVSQTSLRMGMTKVQTKNTVDGQLLCTAPYTSI